MIKVTLDTKSYEDTIVALKTFGKDAEKALKRAVDGTALNIESDAKKKLKNDRHWITGRLATSVHAEKKPNENHGEYSLNERFGDLEAIVGTNVVYAASIEFGSKPHIIEPKNKKFLRFNIGGAWIFAKRVNHPGFKGSSFLRWAAEKNKPVFEKKVTEELNKVINKGPK